MYMNLANFDGPTIVDKQMRSLKIGPYQEELEEETLTCECGGHKAKWKYTEGNLILLVCNECLRELETEAKEDGTIYKVERI
ncbi:hypothetical protein AAA294_07365 [Fusobacterium varium]|uniref:hypothetical protein n=1 Tax=Fusobacterium varium TaxID=856 RepID=UPI0032BFAF68